MLKKLYFILSLILLVNSFNTFAAQYSFDYTIGVQRYSVLFESCVESDGVSFNEGVLSFDEGGSAKYEFYLPFDSDYLEIKYSSSDNVELKALINDVDLMQTADKNNNTISIYFPKIIRMGDCDLRLQSNGVITVEDMSLHKVSEKVSYSGPEEFTAEQRPTVNFTDYEEAVRTAVIINKNSPIIKVNGAKRYIDFDNYKETPYSENSITYLPIQTFAEAFGYYFEENCNEGTFLLRYENTEFVYKDGKLYKQFNHGEYNEIANNTLIKNGIRYIPVKYYAELTGKTVLEKDDYIVADWRDLAEAIVSDEIFPLAQAEFEEFILTDEKGVTYYVAQTDSSSDTNPGTLDKPFATLSKACEVAKAGDKVIIGEGVYREILSPKHNGTANNPIIFQATEGADVTISALEEIGSPDYSENGLWVYEVDWDLGDGRNQIFYKNKALAEGRHPNTHTSKRYYPKQLNLSSLWPTQGNIQVVLTGEADQASSTTDLDQAHGYWQGGTFVSLHGNGYGVATAKISDSEKGKLFLNEMSARLWHKDGGSEAEEHFDFGYITNHMNTVDVPGEWFLGDGKLYICPPEGETIETLKLEAKKRQITVDLSENQYIQLININTVGGGMKLNNSEMCVINGGCHKYISHYIYTDDTEAGFIDTRDNVNDIYDEDGAMYRGEMGIYVGGQNNAIFNAEIKYSASSGICLSGAFSYIKNNSLEECGYMGGGINGICLLDSPLEDISIVKGGHAIYNNTVDKTGRASLNLSSWTYPLVQKRGLVPWIASDIAYNDFLNFNICTRDNGGVYSYGSVLGDERRKTQFHHNLIGNSWASDGYGAGIYWDNWSQMVECYNNIVLYTDKKSEMRRGIHIASAEKYPTAFGYVNSWNNSDAVYKIIGKDGLSVNDYPLNKRFISGFDASASKSELANPTMYKSTDAVITGEGYTLTPDGAVHLNKSDNELSFKNVDFGENCQKLKIVYSGDRYNTGDSLLISIGEGEYQEIALNSNGAKTDNLEECIVDLRNYSGVADVKIKCKEYKSAGIFGIYVCNNESSVNDTYGLNIKEDDDYYYIKGQLDKVSFSEEKASVICCITDYENDLVYSWSEEVISNAENFAFKMKRPDYNGLYSFKLFLWEDTKNLKPLGEMRKYVFAENKYKNAFEKLKFRYADIYPQLLSDNSAVISYGKSDVVLFKNLDFRDEKAKSLRIKYGLNDAEVGKLTIKVYLDTIESSPILTFSPKGTGERWDRKEFVYNLDSVPYGCHNVYFVIEGKSSTPMHLERFSFE